MARRGVPWGEVVLAALGAVAVTVLDGREKIHTLSTSVSGDLGDPLYFAWQLAWVGHALRTAGTDLFTANTFQGQPDNLAYTDVVLGYAPLAWVTPPGQAGALAQLNLALLTATAMATFGGYLLARVLGARVPGALVAAAAFGFAPWRDTQVIHVNVVSTGGIAIATALLLYGHAWSLREGWRPGLMRGRARWVVAGWLTACWQLTIGFATGIWFGYFLAVLMLCLVVGWIRAVRRRDEPPLPRPPTALVAADLAGGLAFLATTVLLAVPHLRVLEQVPEAQRVQGMLDLFSPPWFGLLTAGPANLVWGGQQAGWQAQISQRWPPEMYMSPGVLLIGLAVAGLFISSWPLRGRLVVAAATATLAVLAVGTNGPAGGAFTFVPLWQVLPGWDQLRTPGRLVIWVTLGLAVLAAGAVSRVADELAEDWARREERSWTGADPAAGGPGDRTRLIPAYLSGRHGALGLGLAALLAVPALLVFAEGRDDVPRWTVARAPLDLAALPQPVLILPTGQVADYHLMFWSTEGWPTIANGDSGFNSERQVRLRSDAASFPDQASIAALRERGIATVVVVRSRVGPGSSWEGAADRPVDGLGVPRTDTGDAVVFDLG